jgi:peptidoglycan/xylan/chitin deacetylase (PgdA/CDA1 family)
VLPARIAAHAWRAAVRLAARTRRDVVFLVPTDDPVFALTLDDGPDPALTPRVLDLLRGHEARATFFLLGSRARAHPELVRRILEEGHEIGNHMWRDERASSLSDEAFVDSVASTAATLGQPGAIRLLRPGSGLVGRRKTQLAERRGYRCVLGSVYPLDAHFPSSRFLSRLALHLLEPGAIVILHEGTPARQHVLRLLDDVLAEARQRGLTALPVGELLGSEPDPGADPQLAGTP